MQVYSTATAQDLRLTRRIEWWDADAECTVVISQPTVDPFLWMDYLEGARRSYHTHGVQRALDFDAIRSGTDTVLFWAMVDPTGRVIGGVRAIGPLQSADDSHAVVEWAGQPGEPAIRKAITDRLPFGILEMKSAWVTDDPTRNHSLTRVLARSGFHAMPLMKFQFCMATSAAYVLDRWGSSGGVVAPIPATPYPDERYRTKMMWWDRRTFADLADSEQASKILNEMAEVRRRARRVAPLDLGRAIVS